ncbi:MAG: thioesterase family protein [Actinobacteria bacterium]|nr:thioesterase family protein [Actinomycetota bacterium]
MPNALFQSVGPGSTDGSEIVLPTAFARGPWSPDALHGGPVATLVARAAEGVFTGTFPDAYQVTRLTLDLERPVPLEPITVAARIVRPGRKVQVAEVTVTDSGDRRLARASVLAIRRDPMNPPVGASPNDEVPPTPPERPSGLDGWEFPSSAVAYHNAATEHRLVRGSLASPGPVADWIRLVVPVVASESPTPLQRVAAAADFLNGVSWVLSGAGWLFINPDLTITLHRLPVGEQVMVDAVTRIGDGGTGTAEADLYDTAGRIGRAVQTLLIEAR